MGNFAENLNLGNRVRPPRLFIWTCHKESLHTFINHIHFFHRTIKFTSEFSHQQSTSWMCLSVKMHNTLLTDLYTKPTDTQHYLHSTSCHPSHCNNGIAYIQAHRLSRICSNDSDFSHFTHNLKMQLVSRGHSAKEVQQVINRATESHLLSLSTPTSLLSAT